MSSGLRSFFTNLRKKRIIEILAAFIAGGWFIIEIVHFVLIGHYHFPEKTLDITIITLFSVLLCTLIWRWFSGREKPRKFKLELVLIPLVVLITLLLDINLILHLKGPEPETASAAKWKNSVAVIPFVDISPQKDQEYFCDGMTEELINRLTNIKELRVPARTSAFFFKGKTEDIREIGKKLNVQTILEGSVIKAGDRLRISAQLINIADGYHLWAQTYDRELKDVFAIWDEISLAIANALKLELTPEEKIKMTRRPIDNVQAYDLHVRARYEMWQGTEGALEHAMQLVRSGLEIIGENEILYADLGQGYIFYNDAGIKKEESLFDKTEECIRKIFALNPESSYGHFLRGMILRRRGNAQDAVKEFKHALAINPNNPEFMLWLAWVYIHSGRGYAARPLVNKLFEIDPLTSFSHYGAGVLELINGRFDAGLKELSRALQLEENNPYFQYWYARSLAYAHRYEEAYKLFGLIGKDAPQTI